MNDNTDTDHSNAIVIPPLLYLGFFALGSLLDFFLPQPLLPDLPQYLVGGGMIACSLVIITLVLPRFRKSETTFSVHGPSTSIITTGPYRFSRNPAYVSLTLLYLGLAVVIDSIWIAGLVVPVLVILRFGVIAREEKYLERKFGADYLDYKNSVRRWL